ncbi:MAG: DNA gyrase inhibitor YacG [Planctomycetaceae bacterium]
MIKPLACPICGKEIVDSAAAAESLFPFCSRRCQEVDLYRWSEGRYAIIEPVSPDELQEEEFRSDEPESGR